GFEQHEAQQRRAREDGARRPVLGQALCRRPEERRGQHPHRHGQRHAARPVLVVGVQREGDRERPAAERRERRSSLEPRDAAVAEHRPDEPHEGRLCGMRVVVVGAGVSGLTCGVRLLEEGARVRIVAREAPDRTTSALAGAVWFPYRVRPNERTGPWGRAGYERFERLAADDGAPVTMVELTALYPEPLAEEPWWLTAVPGTTVRAARPDELPRGYGD